MTTEQQTLKRLWLTYKLYGEVSKGKNTQLDTNQYATDCTNNFIEYINNCSETYPHWLEDINTVIENQIRIVSGFIECYDRPVKRDKITNKTRWSL